MIRILMTASLLSLLGLCPLAHGDPCQPQHAACKPTCTASPLAVSDRGPLARSIGQQRCCAGCATLPCWCPNDYCSKPQPCIACPCTCGCPVDYCRKPLPCAPCVSRCGCPDDYCPKPAPNLCIPVNRQSLRCVPMR